MSCLMEEPLSHWMGQCPVFWCFNLNHCISYLGWGRAVVPVRCASMVNAQLNEELWEKVSRKERKLEDMNGRPWGVLRNRGILGRQGLIVIVSTVFRVKNGVVLTRWPKGDEALDGVHIDISKAFHKVLHGGLAQKVRSHGIQDELCGRTEGGNEGLFSDWRPMTIGSVLLFVIHIYDLDENIGNMISKFALGSTKMICYIHNPLGDHHCVDHLSFPSVLLVDS